MGTIGMNTTNITQENATQYCPVKPSCGWLFASQFQHFSHYSSLSPQDSEHVCIVTLFFFPSIG